MEPKYFAHQSASIDDGSEIGEGTKIGHFIHIICNCCIGINCNIGQNVVVSSNVILGDNVRMQNNVSIYEGVTCEDDAFIGPSVVLTNVTNPRSAVNRKEEFKTTLIKRGASIGANATLVCGNTLGNYCFIGAGAVVIKDVPNYAIIIGNPGRQKGCMSEHGQNLKFDEQGYTVCPATQDAYRLSNGVVTKI